MKRNFRLPWDPAIPSDINIPVHWDLRPEAGPPLWVFIVVGALVVLFGFLFLNAISYVRTETTFCDYVPQWAVNLAHQQQLGIAIDITAVNRG